VCVPLGLAALPFVAARLHRATRAHRVQDASRMPAEPPPHIELLPPRLASDAHGSTSSGPPPQP